MDLEAAREQMVEQQVRAWDVLHPGALEVLATVPREAFVPDRYRRLAFADTAIPIGQGQVMMAPKVEGRLLQAVDVQPGESVLEIGTGTGFLTACLAELGGHVDSVDLFPEFTTAARARLDELEIRQATLETADAGRLDEEGRYDVIAVTGSLPVIEPSYERALTLGGRLFVIVGTEPAMQALLVTRVGDKEWTRESLFETVIPSLLNVKAPSAFVF